MKGRDQGEIKFLSKCKKYKKEKEDEVTLTNKQVRQDLPLKLSCLHQLEKLVGQTPLKNMRGLRDFD